MYCLIATSILKAHHNNKVTYNHSYLTSWFLEVIAYKTDIDIFLQACQNKQTSFGFNISFDSSEDTFIDILI